jgi:hypothetical protein
MFGGNHFTLRKKIFDFTTKSVDRIAQIRRLVILRDELYNSTKEFHQGMRTAIISPHNSIYVVL